MFRILLLLFALIAGLAAAWLVVSMQPKSTVVVQAPSQPSGQEVLVSSTTLGMGETLTPASMRWQSWPENMLNSAYITRSTNPEAIENLAGSVLRSRLAAGDPILQDKLVPRNSHLLSALLPSGKRAMAVRVSVETTAGGFVLPNDRVDVVHTVEKQIGNDKEQISRTVLTNVPVLAIDQNLDTKTGDPKAKDDKAASQSSAVGKTVTLELSPKQAEIIASAEAEGRLSLSLRSAADNGQPNETTSRMLVIIRGGQRQVLTLPTQAQESPTKRTIASREMQSGSASAPNSLPAPKGNVRMMAE